MLLDGGLEGLGVGTDDLADLLAVLEQDEGGHGADAEFLGDLGDLVDIELVEAGVGVRVREPFFGGGFFVSLLFPFCLVFFPSCFFSPFRKPGEVWLSQVASDCVAPGRILERERREYGRCCLLDDLRGDDLAGTAPGCEAVEDHEGILYTHGGVKVGLAVGSFSQYFIIVLVWILLCLNAVPPLEGRVCDVFHFCGGLRGRSQTWWGRIV